MNDPVKEKKGKDRRRRRPYIRWRRHWRWLVPWFIVALRAWIRPCFLSLSKFGLFSLSFPTPKRYSKFELGNQRQFIFHIPYTTLPSMINMFLFKFKASKTRTFTFEELLLVYLVLGIDATHAIWK